jgi:hypothetical protein
MVLVHLTYLIIYFIEGQAMGWKINTVKKGRDKKPSGYHDRQDAEHAGGLSTTRR